MSSTIKLGFYNPFMSEKKVTYTYESTVAGWYIYEQEKGKEKIRCRPERVICDLLIQIDDREARLLHTVAMLDDF